MLFGNQPLPLSKSHHPNSRNKQRDIMTASTPDTAATAASSSATNQSSDGNAVKLRRALSLPDLLVYGLAFIVPVAPMAIYGSLVGGAHGLLATAYLVGLIAMLFTALSYGALSKLYPYAGSIYNFVRQGTGSGSVGFIGAWSITLDYLLLPAIQVIIGTTFLQLLIPAVPTWIWTVLLTAIIGTIAILGVDIVSKVSRLLLLLQLVVILWFVAATVISPIQGSTHLNFVAFYNADFSFGNALSATGLVVVCFLGFDAISTLAEESKNPRKNVPAAIVVSVVFIGLLFILITWLAGVVQPNFAAVDPDRGFLDVAGLVGGQPLEIAISITCVLAFPLGCGQESITAVSRILYAIGRDSILPKPFGTLNVKTRTPVFSIAVVTLATLVIALLTNLTIVGNVVSYGALIGFILINLTVIWRLYIRNEDKSVGAFFTYVVSPVLGIAVSLWIFSSLGWLSWTVGTIWLVLGLGIVVWQTQLFRKELPSTNLVQYFA
jgi:amino acid transporter